MARYFELSAPPQGLAADLGPGGHRVAALLHALSARPPSGSHTPGEVEGMPVRQVEDVPAALLDRVDPGWLAWLESRRSEARARLVADGREDRLELAEHVAMLVATPRLEPAEPGDGDALAMSGAILWLLGTLVATSLADDRDDALADLVGHGWWPVGPVDGALLVAPLGLPGRPRGTPPISRVPPEDSRDLPGRSRHG
ncbi:hypothetical protein [Nonomuraea sp. LPB2021202275-12-8]|uniref:hypothetical protein n=1 Tax=Nonomuraea sp. LPB2021202275-12-8 TaxID=3120159 RepID=UPI00300BFE2B